MLSLALTIFWRRPITTVSCSLRPKRACDINSMLRGQHNRVLAVQDVDDITIALSGADTISMAMDEIVDGDISYDEARYEKALGHKVAEA